MGGKIAIVVIKTFHHVITINIQSQLSKNNIEIQYLNGWILITYFFIFLLIKPVGEKTVINLLSYR